MNADEPSTGSDAAAAASQRIEAPLLPSVRRMFSSKLLAMSFACAAGAVASGFLLKLVWDYSLKLGAAAIALIGVCGLGAPLLFISSFVARGCSNCRKLLELRTYAYPAAKYSSLAKKLGRGSDALDAFLDTPAELGPHTAVLNLVVCPTCERLAGARLAERMHGPRGEVRELRKTDERWLAANELDWVKALRENRPVSKLL